MTALLLPYICLALLLATVLLFVCSRRSSASRGQVLKQSAVPRRGLFSKQSAFLRLFAPLSAVLALSTALVLDFAFHVFPLHLFPRKEGSLKVLTLNVHSASADFDAAALADLICSEDPDLICLEEHIYSLSWDLHSALRQRGYYADWNWNEMGIYCRWPLSKVEELRRRPDFRDELYHTRIGVNGRDTLDLFFCHMASNNLTAESSVPVHLDSLRSVSQFRSYLLNLSAAGRQRGQQAAHLCSYLEGSRPTLVLGDMNDVWGSPALRVFASHGLEDAWWKRGLGYGSTISHPLPFRIDHILSSPALKLRTIRRLRTRSFSGHSLRTRSLSDHDALVATFDF